MHLSKNINSNEGNVNSKYWYIGRYQFTWFLVRDTMFLSFYMIVSLPLVLIC